MGVIKAVLGWVWGLIFGKPPQVQPSGKLVDHVEVVQDSSGKKVKIVYFTDGSQETQPYVPSDPTGEAGFIDSLPK